MKELPILFSTPMVQAILEGRKTMTRRTAGLKQINYDPHLWRFDGFNEENIPAFEVIRSDGSYTEFYKNVKPRYQVGDHLWVRETFFNAKPFKSAPLFSDGHDYIYRADKDSFIGDHKWKPSLFMPKAAARIWLEVTGVRCERLQDISEQDAIAEGIKLNSLFEQYECPVCGDKGHSGGDLICDDGFFSHAIDAFASLWHKINGFDSWMLDPWVFIYEFKRIDHA